MTYLDKRRFEKIIEENRRRLETARRFEEPDRVPVVIHLGGPYYAKLFGYTLAQYYNDLRVMLEVQVRGLKWRLTWLKDDITWVGIGLDIGSIAEGLVFDCKVVMPDDSRPWQSPWIVPRIKSLEDIDKLEVPDPYSHRGIKEYYSKLARFRKIARSICDLPVGGRLQIHPPFSAAGSLLGPQRLYTWIYRYPNELHKLLRKLEETFIVLQEFYYEITGSELEGLGLADDHAGYLNREMYKKFVEPYNSRLYERFGKRHRALHMDSRMDHITDILKRVYKLNEADVGVENNIRIIAREFKDSIVFKGNADWRVLLSGKLEMVEREVEKCIYYAAPGGGYIFDNGGETYAEVPPEMLRYEVEYAKRIGRYPLKLERFKYIGRHGRWGIQETG